MRFHLPPVSLLPLERYSSLLGSQRMQEVAIRVAELRARLAGRVVWNISSTSSGGGVAEMVRSLLAYAHGAGVDARWVVIQGSPDFFRITKRLHNAIHGNSGDHSPLGDEERRTYERIALESAIELMPMVRPRDIVIIHDPQPAAMIPHLRNRGAEVIWRCHIGGDTPNEESAAAWSFLQPYLKLAPAYVFTRAAYIPAQLDASRATLIAPSLDPFSAKNQALSPSAIRAILAHAGILSGPPSGELSLFVRVDGTPGRVDRHAEVLHEGAPPSVDTPLVVQVSRWDRLKDPIGVIHGFLRMKAPQGRAAQLVLAGPNVSTIADDPEDALVFSEVVGAWRSLTADERARVLIAAIPTVDVEENAAIINALQRHAAIVVQKSLHEGFGLTVTEAMWKSRPVIASAVGGIQDQIEDGVQGLLLRNPVDLDAFAADLEKLLSDPELSRRMGEKGHERVLKRYMGIDALLHYGDLIESLDKRLALSA